MPGQDILEVNELQEIDTMLAERVEEWTAQWKRDGKIEGNLEGETSLIERQITRRFGTPSAETQARLKAANLEQIEQWQKTSSAPPPWKTFSRTTDTQPA